MPRPILLATAAAAALATLVAVGCDKPSEAVATTTPSCLNDSSTGGPLTYPADTFSHAGVLKLRMTMQPGVGPNGDTTNLFDGQYAPPTLHLNPGDSIDMWVVNQMAANANQNAGQVDTTNYHYHGFVATPQPYRAVAGVDTSSGDNVVQRHIAVGDSVHFGLRIPTDHAQGTFWYHPHPHGNTDPQVSGGLAGAIVVGQIDTLFREYTVPAGGKVMLIKDLNQNGLYSINGVMCPRLQIQQGEQQLWHVLNATAEDFLNLKLKGLQFSVLAYDGNPVVSPIAADSLLLAPGSRADVVVIGGAPGSTSLYSDSAGAHGGFVVPTLAWLVTTPTTAPIVVPGRPTTNQALQDSIDALFAATPQQYKTWTYHVDSTGNVYSFNDTLYSATRLDYSIPILTVQEDTLINTTGELHSFHLHQTDMLVTSINGQPPADSVFRDNIFVGVHAVQQNGATTYVGDTVVIRFKFQPIAVGPFVFHCHQLFHEDAGMMRNVCVYDPNNPKSSQDCTNWFPGGSATAHGH